MPLQKQNQVVPVRGLDTFSDPKSAPPGALELVENMTARRSALGGVELRKRFGVTARTTNKFTTGAVVAGAALDTFRDEQLLFDGVDGDSRVYSWIPGQSKWHAKGSASFATVTTEVMGPDAIPTATHDIAVGGGYMLVVYQGSSYYTIVDLASGERVVSSVILNGLITTGVRAIALSDRFLIFGWNATAGGNVTGLPIMFSTPSTIGTGVIVATDLNVANPRIDLTRIGSTDVVMAVYNKTVAGLKVLVINAALTTGASATHADIPDAAIGWFAWPATDSNLYAGFVGAASGAKYVTVTTAGAITSTTTMDAAVTAARNITGYRDGVTNNALIEVSAAITFNTLIRGWSFSGASFVMQRGAGLASRAFKVGVRHFVALVYDSPLQTSAFVADVTAVVANTTQSPPIAAKFLYGRGAKINTATPTSLGAVAAIDSRVVAISSPRAFAAGSSSLYLPNVARIDFGGTGLSNGRVLGENLHIPGGNVRAYDSGTYAEAGFHLFPELPTYTVAAGAFTGTYKVKVVYSHTGVRGQIHRSAPSEPLTVTLAAQTPTFSITTLRLGERPTTTAVTNFRIEVYRTANNGDNYFRVDDGTLYNNPLVDVVSYGPGLGIASDVTLLAQEELYTNGGVLAHLPLPPAKFIEAFQGRLFLAGTDIANELWVSNESAPDEGVSVSDQLVIKLEAEGGAETALAEDDGRLLIFKEAAIYALSGAGPSLNGAGQFEQPQRIFTGVGATSQAGVVKTPAGVMFKSPKGMYLLPRGASTPVRMKGVAAYDSLTVTGAVLMEALEEVRFTTSAGTTLVYHYGLPDETGVGAWTVFTGQVAVDCAVFDGAFVYLTSAGVVQVEVADQYNDNAAAIAAKVRTCWINLASLFGNPRLYGVEAILQAMATVTVTGELAYDYDATVAETTTKALTTAVYPPLLDPPARGRADAVQVTIRESSTTQGFRLTAIACEIGVKAGMRKMGADRRFG